MIGAVIISAIIGGLIGFILAIMTTVNRNNEKMYMDQYKKGYEDAKRIYRGR